MENKEYYKDLYTITIVNLSIFNKKELKSIYNHYIIDKSNFIDIETVKWLKSLYLVDNKNELYDYTKYILLKTKQKFM